MVGFLKEIFLSMLAVLAASAGLVLVQVACTVFWEDIDSWWQVPISFALMILVAGVGVAILGLGTVFPVDDLAKGWQGMLTGRVPPSHRASSENSWRAVADLGLFGLSLWLGITVFRAGVAEAELGWTNMGILLILAGGIFGLLPAVPRLYFAVKTPGRSQLFGKKSKRQKRIERTNARDARQQEESRVIWFVIAALLSMALSLSASDLVQKIRLGQSDTALPFGRQVISTITEPVTFRIEPREFRRSRVEYWGRCDLRLGRGDGTVVGRQKSPLPDDEGWLFVFDPKPGESYTLQVTPPAADMCTYLIRYRFEPPVERGGVAVKEVTR